MPGDGEASLDGDDDDDYDDEDDDALENLEEEDFDGSDGAFTFPYIEIAFFMDTNFRSFKTSGYFSGINFCSLITNMSFYVTNAFMWVLFFIEKG